MADRDENHQQRLGNDSPQYEGKGKSLPRPDASQQPLEQVEKLTESGPVDGAELLGSEELKRQLREAKARESNRSNSDRLN